MASFYLDGDGRRTLFPHNAPLGVHSHWVRRSAARSMIHEFMGTGWFHAHAGVHAWIIYNYCEEQGIAYKSSIQYFDDDANNPIEWITIEKCEHPAPASKNLPSDGEDMPLNIRHHAVIVTGIEHDQNFSLALETARKYFRPDLITAPTRDNRNAIATFVVAPSGYTDGTDQEKKHAQSLIDFCAEMKGYISLSYVSLSWSADESPIIDDAHLLD